jgi:hypothetical protein
MPKAIVTAHTLYIYIYIYNLFTYYEKRSSLKRRFQILDMAASTATVLTYACHKKETK